MLATVMASSMMGLVMKLCSVVLATDQRAAMAEVMVWWTGSMAAQLV